MICIGPDLVFIFSAFLFRQNHAIQILIELETPATHEQPSNKEIESKTKNEEAGKHRQGNEFFNSYYMNLKNKYP